MSFNNQRNSRDDKSKRQRSNSESFKSKGNSSSRKFTSSKGESFEKPSFRKDDKKAFGKPSFSKDRSDDKNSYNKSSRFTKDNNGDKKTFTKSSFSRDKSDDKRGFNKSSNSSWDSNRKSFDKPFRSTEGKSDDRKPFGKPSFSKSKNDGGRSFDKPFRSGEDRGDEKRSFGKSSFSRNQNESGRSFDRPSRFSKDGNRTSENPRNRNFKSETRTGATSEYIEQRENNDFKYSANRKFRPANKPANKQVEDDGLIRLNRYISNSGICSRRKADELIEAGVISVNGEVVTELGTRVDPAKDEIRYNSERLKREKMVYVLLNKPKDYITTTDDPQERRTVMQLVAKATKERIYPVGRLDRNTTGLLLLTNDGNLADKLSHPKNGITKIYQVELNKNLAQGDFNKIQFGLELEDGFIKPDDISYVTGASKREVGIQIHSGKNRIVRRIFESLGYEVIKLDRVVYANLTKKDLPRGRWRFLEEKELVQLKHLIK